MFEFVNGRRTDAGPCLYLLYELVSSDELKRGQVETPFPHYKLMGAICCQRNQIFESIFPDRET